MNKKSKNITKIIGPCNAPTLIKAQMSEDQLQRDYKYCMAQKIVKSMHEKGLLSVVECDKISEINRKTFSPYFADIIP